MACFPFHITAWTATILDGGVHCAAFSRLSKGEAMASSASGRSNPSRGSRGKRSVRNPSRGSRGKRSVRNPGGARPYKKIATEEAFATPELFREYRKILAERRLDDPGFFSLWGFYLNSPSERPRAIIEKLQWLDERRIQDMDATGIDMQVLSLTGPGVQIFDAATAVSMARSSNDQLAEAVAKHPTRFAGL